MSYAEKTTTSVEKSRSEIERTLQRYGATSFSYGWDANRAAVAFVVDDRQIRFLIDMPDRQDRQFTHHTRGKREVATADKLWEQACRQRWRALALVVKAKLEAVESGISTVENEFLAWITLPDGRTVGDWVAPELQRVYEGGRMTTVCALGPA